MLVATAAFLKKSLGRIADAASATGSANAKASEHLARFGSTQAGRIDVAISSLLAGHKSIQTGEILLPQGTGSATLTLTAVDTAKSRLHFSHCQNEADARAHPRVVFTNGTTITASRTTIGGSGGETIVRVTVYEVN